MAKFFVLLSLVLVLTEARQLTEEQVQQLTDAWQLAEAQAISYNREAKGSDLVNTYTNPSGW